MLPPGHLAFGYILACLLHRVGLCGGFMFYGMWVPAFYVVIIASVIPDADYLIRHSHRDFFTHTPFFWLCLLTLLIIWQHQYMVLLLAVMIAVMFHLVLDTIDWGVMLLYPVSKKRYGLKILSILENLEDVPQTYFFKSYLSNRKLIFFEGLLIFIAILLYIFHTLKLSCTLIITETYYTSAWYISPVIEYLLPLRLYSVIVLEIIVFIVFLIYFIKFDKNRKQFLKDAYKKDKITALVNISLTTAVSMASLAGIMLSLLFGFVISTSNDPDLQFIRIMTWIITVCFISTSSFIAASMAYHISEYMGKTKNGEDIIKEDIIKEDIIKEDIIKEDIINAFRVGTFFYVLGLSFFVLTITLLMLEVISYFDVGTPFISAIVLFHAIIAIAILCFVLKPVLRILMR